MRPFLVVLSLFALLPLDPVPAAATLSSIEVSLDRATAWRSRSKLGRIRAEGTFRAVGAPFDKTQIIVTVSDGQDLAESGTFTSCREYPSGAVRCQNDDRTARLRYIPDRTEPDLYRYKLDYRRRDITRPQVAPLQIEFDYAGGAATAAAKNEPCQVLNAKLVCKGESAPVCLPEPEICDGLDNDCNGAIDDGLDVDGDGISVCSGDCDDGDPTVFPGAAELCDLLDNDCDGVIDEGLDGDADGFSVCLGDCDDGDPTVFPGAVELCDGLDNDCNGAIDDGLDVDGDGISVCSGDCDDGDATVFPGAAELCDGLDNDCDILVDEGGVCASCPCLDFWDEGVSAPPLSSTALTSCFTDAGSYFGFPDVGPWYGFGRGDFPFARCIVDETRTPLFEMLQPERDACIAFLVSRGCPPVWGSPQ